MTWLAAKGGYEVTLRSRKGGPAVVICRNAKGKELQSIPATLREEPAVTSLRHLVEWLGRHQAQCRAEAERWMVRSLPVPTPVLVGVWPDETWRSVLTDLVVTVLDADGRWDPEQVGLLREASDKGIGMVNLDGESVRLAADRVLIPHPVTLPDLDDLREFAADLEVSQAIDQLFRETWRKPIDATAQAVALKEYAGGKYAQLRHLLARATSLGFPVRGGYAVCRVFEGGRSVEARSWVGSDDPNYETETGDLVFTDRDGTALPLAEVGPVTWSEGLRMAATLFAGRVVETEQKVGS